MTELDPDRQRLKEEVRRARGQFGPWHEGLLQHDPDLLRRVHELVLSAEAGGQISEKLRHLIWIAADAVVTHLYPRGIGIHARRALEAGATVAELFEALELACTVSAGSFAKGLPIVLEELQRAGTPEPERALTPEDSAFKAAFTAQAGLWPDWMELALRTRPDYLRRLAGLGYPMAGERRLDAKSRELILLGIQACPAVLDEPGIRRHARRAIELGATGAELIEVLQLASGIGIHALSIGVPAMVEPIEATGSV